MSSLGKCPGVDKTTEKTQKVNVLNKCENESISSSQPVIYPATRIHPLILAFFIHSRLLEALPTQTQPPIVISSDSEEENDPVDQEE